ncbi:PRC and DUF2382 domain-containing protein [Allokutzneria sp. A3M-2-11 16]|uniref:DUF2382 domain-containing protein n=1 Tax=Allokutzneria sp. A3M-2-11 16 TaxID=2962043 RepID=UPI0020B83914|nr:PRC and DUF2382 domain-containing protein [Allokutzneria sp. A3M-2-11 16]MCP3800554.1 PRC and DUF2382 domain-containing protein [Allokutzneria sp. A3M-2-11 16]
MVQQLFGDEVYDRHGDKIGKVGQVYLDDQTGQPVWVTVRTGLFGMKESFVPLNQAHVDGDAVHVHVSKDQVKDAPRMDVDGGHMSRAEERQLYSYYGIEYAALPGQRQSERGGQRPARDDATEMTRSEERLRVGTEQVETGKVRLRKHVVTEQQQVSVPVRHEEVRLEREPIAEGAARGTERIGEAEQEVTLHAEKPVVSKETVPVERVRMSKETVTEQQRVAGEVRKEEIDVDDASKRRRNTP